MIIPESTLIDGLLAVLVFREGNRELSLQI